MKTCSKIILVLLAISLSCVYSYGKGIKGSPHDLSALESRGTCNFCHTAHGALRQTPLWSHKLSNTVYKIYQSSSLDAKVGHHQISQAGGPRPG